ncbi:MAG: hypothetical protein FWG45_02540 [Oscillospiraceae bacterium]|nr:hypothetical protein [Oscillospiraceae bacterium]
MREILLNICMTSIALCLFKMLLPENVMKKQVSFLIACFFLASVLFFFTTGKFDLARDLDITRASAETYAFADFDEVYTAAQKRAIERETKRAMTFRVTELLEGVEGFRSENLSEICTSVNISDSLCISISEVRLVLTLEGVQPSDEELALLTDAVHIIQKEVGEKTLVTGEFKSQGGQ